MTTPEFDGHGTVFLPTCTCTFQPILGEDAEARYRFAVATPPRFGRMWQKRLAPRYSCVMEVEGIQVSVATPDELYRLKKDTVRPLDRADAERLRQQFDLVDD